MVYLIVVSGVASLVTLLLLVFVIPAFNSVFASFGGELPLPTRILLAISDFLRHNFLYLMAIPVGTFIGVKKWYATEKGMTFIDGWLIRIPVSGDLLKKVAV